jgi:hypothetical protein
LNDGIENIQVGCGGFLGENRDATRDPQEQRNISMFASHIMGVLSGFIFRATRLVYSISECTLSSCEPIKLPQTGCRRCHSSFTLTHASAITAIGIPIFEEPF